MLEREDLDKVMAYPNLFLAVERLQNGRVGIRTQDGGPWRNVGSFAIVYKFCDDNERWCALRCFIIPPNAETSSNYSKISAYFQAHIPQITTGFQYHDACIKWYQEEKYPLIEMDWIEGDDLTNHVKQLL